jgi:hypothetical protein
MNYSLRKIYDLRFALEHVLMPFVGKIPDHAGLTLIAQQITSVFTPKNTTDTQRLFVFKAVTTTLKHIASLEPLTAAQLSLLAVRLAGNVQKVVAGLDVVPFSSLERAELCFARIVEAVHTEVGARLAVEIATGSPAGVRVWQPITRAGVRLIAKRAGIVGKFETRVVYPEELVGMFIRVWINPSESEELILGNVEHDAHVLDSNKRRAKERIPSPTRACVLNHPTLPCYACSCGQDICANACRLATPIEQKVCSECKRETRMFGNVCVECLALSWFEDTPS